MGGDRCREQWRSRLHERLRWADAVVCVATSGRAVASPWCLYETRLVGINVEGHLLAFTLAQLAGLADHGVDLW